MELRHVQALSMQGSVALDEDKARMMAIIFL